MLKMNGLRLMAFLLVLVLLISGFAVAVHGAPALPPSSGAGARTATPSDFPAYSSGPAVGSSVQAYGDLANNTGSVKYTLDLMNDTLASGLSIMEQGVSPVQVTIDPKDGYLFVNCVFIYGEVNGNVVLNMSTGKLIKYFNGLDTLYNPLNGHIYFSLYGTHIYILNGTSIIGEINVSSFYLFFNPINKNIYDIGRGVITIINGTTNEIVAKISDSNYPQAIVFDDNNGNVYVLNWNNIMVLNGMTNKIITNISVSGDFGAFDPHNNYIYVLTQNNITIINGQTNQIVGGIPLKNTGDIAYDPENNNIYISNFNNNIVSVVSGLTNKVIENISVQEPGLLTYFNGNIYVPSFDNEIIYVISGLTNRIVRTYYTALLPMGVAVNPTNNDVYVAESNSNNLTVISGLTHRIIVSVPVGSEPMNVLYDQINNYIYVSNYKSNNITVINASTYTSVANISVGKGPAEMLIGPQPDLIYVANSGSNTVSVLNATSNAVVSTIPVGNGPWGLAYYPRLNYIYVTDASSSDVSVINASTDSVVNTIAVGAHPAGIAVDPGNGEVYVAVSSKVVVFNASTGDIINNISGGSGFNIWNLAFDPLNNYIYATPFFFGFIFAINTINNSVVRLVSNCTVAYGISVAQNGMVYVSDYLNGLVYMIQTPVYSITFHETGLPSSVPWSVTLNGTAVSSRTGTISFLRVNGTYLFSVARVNGYNATPSNGTVAVNGTNVSVTITFKSTVAQSYTIIIIVIIAIVAVLAVIFLRRGRNKSGGGKE